MEVLAGLQRGQPHVFSLARTAYHRMLHYHQDQVLLAHGYQTAGKGRLVRSALRCFLHLGRAEGGRPGVPAKVLSADWVVRALLGEEGGGASLIHLGFNTSGQVRAAPDMETR